MKPKILALSIILILITPALAQVRGVRANVPFDFVVGTKAMSAGEYRLSLISGVTLRISQINGPGMAGIVAAPVAGSDNNAPRLLFHRYGSHFFLTEVWVGETSISHRLYVSPAELGYARTTAPEAITILAKK